jgi:hypothetical protein
VADARVFHLQASAGSLEVNEMYVLKNDSQPPRSKIGNQTFAVTLPDGAVMGEASTTGPSGMPLPATPVPSGVKDRYAFDFPIRPGETRFDVFYKLPYSGAYEFAVTPETQLNELGVLLPKSMKFTGVSGGFTQDTDEAGLAVYFAKNVAANQQVKFSVTGEGLISRDVPGAGEGQPAGPSIVPTQSGSAAASWFMVGGTVLLIGGGALVLWRKTAAKNSARDPKSAKSASKKARAQAQSQPARPAQGDMLEALKDELFQLETDRLSGKISQEEYDKTKAGLDTLFRRQIKKNR